MRATVPAVSEADFSRSWACSATPRMERAISSTVAAVSSTAAAMVAPSRAALSSSALASVEATCIAAVRSPIALASAESLEMPLDISSMVAATSSTPAARVSPRV